MTTIWNCHLCFYTVSDFNSFEICTIKCIWLYYIVTMCLQHLKNPVFPTIWLFKYLGIWCFHSRSSRQFPFFYLCIYLNKNMVGSTCCYYSMCVCVLYIYIIYIYDSPWSNTWWGMIWLSTHEQGYLASMHGALVSSCRQRAQVSCLSPAILPVVCQTLWEAYSYCDWMGLESAPSGLNV